MSQHGNLDIKSASEVIKILKDIAKDKLIIMVTHNVEQVEECATRIIKMKDGIIIEDKTTKDPIKEIPLNQLKQPKAKHSLINSYKLGIRNTFNIVSKFLLLFFVFLFMIISFFTEYTILKAKETEASETYSRVNFNDLSDNRILIKKQDKTSFTEEDYKKIEENNNINAIVKNDYILDGYIGLYDRKAKGYFMNSDMVMYDYNISISGYAYLIDTFEGKLDIGRMPENENEVVLKVNPKNPSIKVKNNLDELLDTSLGVSLGKTFNSDGEYKDSVRAKIVGISYARR